MQKVICLLTKEFGQLLVTCIMYTVQSQPISLLQTRITNQFILTSSLTRKYKEWDIKVTNQIEFINIQKINKL